MNSKRPIPTYVIIQMPHFTDKERILKAVKEEKRKKRAVYKVHPIKLAADFLMETLKARREWQKIFQVLKSTGLEPRLLYSARFSIKMEGEIRS